MRRRGRVYHGIPAVRERFTIIEASPFGWEQLRWIYRELRRQGVRPSTARLAVLHPIIAGCTSVDEMAPR